GVQRELFGLIAVLQKLDDRRGQEKSCRYGKNEENDDDHQPFSQFFYMLNNRKLLFIHNDNVLTGRHHLASFCSTASFCSAAFFVLSSSSSTRPFVAFLNSRSDEPTALPNSGSFFGPKMMSATMAMMIRLIAPGDMTARTLLIHYVYTKE